jgi:hypothetical protein
MVRKPSLHVGDVWQLISSTPIVVRTLSFTSVNMNYYHLDVEAG